MQTKQTSPVLPALQRQLRHPDVRTTLKTYARAIPESQRLAAEEVSVGIRTVVPISQRSALNPCGISEKWCPGWESNPHEDKSPEDFKSSASAIPPPGQRAVTHSLYRLTDIFSLLGIAAILCIYERTMNVGLGEFGPGPTLNFQGRVC